MRGWVCNLQLLLALARAVILEYESRETHDHNLLPQIRYSPQPGGAGPRIYISQEQGGPVIPQELRSFSSLPTTWARVEVLDPSSTRATSL
jgi:hypothetical protein